MRMFDTEEHIEHIKTHRTHRDTEHIETHKYTGIRISLTDPRCKVNSERSLLLLHMCTYMSTTRVNYAELVAYTMC